MGYGDAGLRLRNGDAVSDFEREMIDRAARIEVKLDGLMLLPDKVQEHGRRIGRIETACWTIGLVLGSVGALATIVKIASALAAVVPV